MLYNPQWRDQDPLTLTSFIAWLEQQPAKGKYDWWTPNRCLACQYLKATGHNQEGQKHTGYETIFGRARSKETLVTYHKVCGTRPWTYGAALSRARDVLAEKQSVSPRG